jgi:hypothetical protein
VAIVGKMARNTMTTNMNILIFFFFLTTFILFSNLQIFTYNQRLYSIRKTGYT